MTKDRVTRIIDVLSTIADILGQIKHVLLDLSQDVRALRRRPYRALCTTCGGTGTETCGVPPISRGFPRHCPNCNGHGYLWAAEEPTS